MSNEDTLPPRKPNTLRTWLPRAWAWFLSLPDAVRWSVAGLMTGLLLPHIARLLF